MPTNPKLTRRTLLTLGTLLPFTQRAIAEPGGSTCALTPAQTTGPFYPLFAQKTDTDVDLTRLTGHGAAARGTVIGVPLAGAGAGDAPTFTFEATIAKG